MAKSVTIILNEGLAPDFQFEGHWTGHDVKACLANFTLHYKLYNRGIRREALKPKPQAKQSKKETITTITKEV